MSDNDRSDAYAGWAIVELFGHRRLAGHVSLVEQYGGAMLRLDVPGEGETFEATQFYGAAAIYCLTPTTEEIARAVAQRNKPSPVQQWELAPPKPAAERVGVETIDDYDDHDEDEDEDEEPDLGPRW